uniref:Putative RNA-directed DNA polymerase from transposon X-element n=1 Tax=Bactrocera latifrons TaxID=174628 RepID=A0A0K8U8T5_BACLA
MVYAPQGLSVSATCVENKITLCELISALQHAKGKTPGINSISYPMLSNLPPIAKQRLLSLYNSIFEKGSYPHPWRIATVIPIIKPNKPADLPSSYRPISLLSCLSKIFEKIIAKRLTWFVTKNKHIKQNQTHLGTSAVLLTHLSSYSILFLTLLQPKTMPQSCPPISKKRSIA